MKHTQNHSIHTAIIAIYSFIYCFNGTMVTETPQTTSTDPDVNFYGILQDHAHSAPVEYILIGSKYESIPVYQTVNVKEKSDKNNEIDPRHNKTLINLQDIKSISLEHPDNPTLSSITVNNRTYIQIIVESLQGTLKKYLIESSRKISCQEVDKKAESSEKPVLQKRDLNFIHVKKLTIQGYKANSAYKTTSPEIVQPTSNQESKSFKSPKDSSELSIEKNKFKNNAAEIILAIEENVKNLPIDNPGAFETMKSTIVTLLKTLRDQLQKFLDMVK
ncbi:MAG: hypothetical protein ACXWL2_00310 [Candidatus Chromulinivorax sp.]